MASMAHLVESARHLADLVSGVHVDGHDILRHSLAIGLVNPPHRLWQPPTSHLQSAPLRRRRSGRIMDLPTATVARNASTRMSTTTALQMTADTTALCSSVLVRETTPATSCCSARSHAGADGVEGRR